jgi:hypothetical protein
MELGSHLLSIRIFALANGEQGTDWTTLKKLVKLEAKKGNPIAQLIHQLKLETNQVTMFIT